ncbi:hypothetical protein HN873_058422, partial [Arachis hypogaea]
RRVQSSARAFAPLRPINVARSLVLPLRGSSLSDPLSASWSFSNLLHSRDCSFSPVSCLFSDCRRRNKLPPLPLHSDPPLHCFLTPASLFLFFTSDSDLCPSPSTFPSATYSFKASKFIYVAPEYACSGMLTKKSDVYSFGILIMEIITGRSSVDYSKSQGEVNLIEWLKAMVGNRKSEELIDQKLPEKPSSKALKLCSVDATKKPKIGHIIHMLEADEILFGDERRTGGESLRSHGNYHLEQKDSSRDRKRIGGKINDRNEDDNSSKNLVQPTRLR